MPPCLVRLATVVAGRQRPHAAARAETVTREATESLNQAEILVGAICAQAASDRLDPRALRADVGGRWWPPALTDVPLERILRRLREGSRSWAELRPGEGLALSWRVR